MRLIQMKKTLSTLLAAAMLFALLPATALAVGETCIVPDCTVPIAEGAFTSSEEIEGMVYYHVSTAEQLAHINEHRHLNYIQTKDIDLSGYNDGLWEPIGGFSGSGWFSGFYLGNGYTIKNLKIDLITMVDSDTFAGLFGQTTESAHFEGINLEIDSISITGGEYAYIGGIAATHYSPRTIEDCHVTISGNVNAESMYDIYMGGIVGVNAGKITGCSTTTSVTSVITMKTGSSDEAFVGGIAGITSGDIFGSDNFGRLHAEVPAESSTSKLYVGGIAGYVWDSLKGTVIENCQNNADIESINLCDYNNSYRAYAGGIVGHMDNVSSLTAVIIKNCANIGADKQVYTKAPSTLTGGIAGSSRFTSETNNRIENCYNLSKVKSEMLDFVTRKATELCTGVTAGGIIGATGNIDLRYNYSAGAEVSATATPVEDAYFGGVAGLIWDTQLTQNYYETNSELLDGIGGSVEKALQYQSLGSSMEIVPFEDVLGMVEGASADQLKTKAFYGDGWQWYTDGGTEPDYYSSSSPWRFTAAGTYPVLRGAPDSGYNASLSSLTASGVTLSPTFSGAVTGYSGSVSNSVSSTTISAICSDPSATVSINGVVGPNSDVPLSVGSNTITVVVTAQDGETTRTYTIVINRAPADSGVWYPPVSPPTHDCPSKKFTDVDINKWYHKAIDFAISKGLFNGTSDTTFQPDADTSRAMLVTVLWRLEDKPLSTVSNVFKDVVSETWYTDAIDWAAEYDIILGYDEFTFGPNDPVTREQMAAILHRYAEYKGYDVSVGLDTNILSYEDAFKVSEYAIPSIQWACGAGIMQGDGAKLYPRGNATRAEFAEMLMKFIDNVTK